MPLQNLGVGLTYFEGIEPILNSDRDLVDLIEIEPQTIWFYRRDSPNKYEIDHDALQRLESIKINKLLHGVGFPVGGTTLPDPAHIPPLLTMIRCLNIPWMSEHLSFNQITKPGRKFCTGFLLPPRQTIEGVSAAVESISYMKNSITVPFAVETGVNYLRSREDELNDGEFISRVVRSADCGILLDLHNIWANELNGRQRVNDFINQIPLERVWEVHLAGGNEQDGYWLDSHSDGIDERLIEVAKYVVPRLPNLRAIIFEIFPPYVPVVGMDVLRSQLKVLHEIWDSRGRISVENHSQAKTLTKNKPFRTSDYRPTEWEHALGSLVIGQLPSGKLASELSKDPGIIVIKKLLSSFRSSIIARTLRLTFRLLFLNLGENGCMELIQDYWKESPPELFSSAEAQGFSEYLNRKKLNLEYLDEILNYELGVMNSIIYQEDRLVRFQHDPIPLIRSLAKGKLPQLSIAGDFEIEITCDKTESNMHLKMNVSH